MIPPKDGTQLAVLGAILEERQRQGEQNHPDETWCRIALEELGEAAKEINDHTPRRRLYEEVVQVAAVALSWAENLHRQMQKETP